MALYSHSRLSTFEQCPLKFKYKYIDKIDSEIEATIEVFLGSRVHEILEKLYNDLKFQKLNSLQELINFFHEQWEKHWNENIVIIRNEYTKENYKDMGIKFITDYYNKYKPFNDSRLISTEERIVIDLDENHQLQGYIDRLSFKDGVYQIHDYKTANNLPLQEYLDHDRQLALYSIAVKERYQDAKEIKLIWHFLAFDKELSSSRTDQELENLKKETLELIKGIEDCKEFSHKVSKLCDWCEFRNLCPNFSHLYELEKKEIKEYKDDHGLKLVDKYSELKLKEKEISEELDNLKKEIVKFSFDKNINTVFGSDSKIKIWIRDCLKLPGKHDWKFKEIVKILKNSEVWDKIETIDTWDLIKLIETGSVSEEVLIKLKDFIRKEKIERLYLSGR
ncbi:MAG: PD-(D/E)XK nuclease family protein [Nanoarchaeota archaeon]|nr:PD-(D/E)XK nuclease family protein [Nanoarchaeota archaeon]